MKWLKRVYEWLFSIEDYGDNNFEVSFRHYPITIYSVMSVKDQDGVDLRFCRLGWSKYRIEVAPNTKKITMDLWARHSLSDGLRDTGHVRATITKDDPGTAY